MAYQAKRARKVIEEFELVDENGQVVEQMHVELNVDSMAKKLREKHLALVRTHAKLYSLQVHMASREDLEEAYMTLGYAVSDMVESVFGAEDAKKIMDFFENNYSDITKEVMPFIQTVIIPKVEQMAKDNKRELLSKYNRKQRRMFLKGKR